MGACDHGRNDMRTVLTCVIAATALLGAGPDRAEAQDAAYPNRPVKIMIAFPVGGLLDTVSRVVGDKLSARLGQQFIIESRPGGYTLMMINEPGIRNQE